MNQGNMYLVRGFQRLVGCGSLLCWWGIYTGRKSDGGSEVLRERVETSLARYSNRVRAGYVISRQSHRKRPSGEQGKGGVELDEVNRTGMYSMSRCVRIA